MATFKKILFAIITAVVLYYAPYLAPYIGQFLGASGFLAVAIGLTVIVTGLYIAQSLLITRPNAPSIEAGKINVRIPEPGRWICCGRVRQGGAVLFAEFDDVGNLWYLVVHADSILTSTVDVIFDETIVTLDGSGNVTSDDFCLTSKFEPYEGTGTKVPYVQIWTTTHSETDPIPPRITALDAAFPSKWTSDHKLVGTTFSVIRMNALKIENRYKIYKWRGPIGLGEPNVGIIGIWSNCYDPRDITQTLGDRTTYKPSRNTALVWAWFRTHPFGRNKPEATVNWDMVAEQADICDETVTGISGDHVRYQCDMAIPDSKERFVAEQEILLSCDGQLVFDDDGKCWARVGKYYTPTLTLSRNRDILAMESVEAQNGESETQGVVVRYLDPEANYTTQPAAPWYNPNYYVSGQPATFLTVEILSVQDHNQAMRLAKSIGMRSQPIHKILPTVGLRGLKARQERVINLNYDNTFAGDYEIVTPVEVDDQGLFCGFGLVPIDEDRFDLLSGEEKPKPVISDAATTYSIAAPTGVTVAFNNSRIEANFTPASRDDIDYQFQFIVAADVATDRWLEMSVDMAGAFAYSGTLSQSITYLVHWRAVSSAGRVSAWSSNYTLNGVINPPSTPTSPQATGAVGHADLAWRNPSEANFGFVRPYRNTVNTFGTATALTDTPGALLAIQTYTDTIAAGTYYYWFVSYDASGTAFSAPTTSVSATVT